jgi:cap1 methyltransferase
MKEGDRKSTIDDETHFCDEEVLSCIMQCKSIFDRLGVAEMQRARTRSNPFETIRGGIFLNRAAMKMANMDAMLDFMFTNPSKAKSD